MAVQLHAWLEDTFAWQLVLGNHWLQGRHEQKKAGVKTERDRAWEGLYHDNGSCLDITNYIHPEHNSALQVIQTRPWTLTDGRNHIVAHLTPDCTRDFATRCPAVSYLSPGSIIAVRKYTIQSTSYGPPRHKLRFLLHHIDWLGLSCQTSCDLDTVDLVPLYHQGAIGAAQKQLHETRAREDRRCLSVGEAQSNNSMSDTDDAPDSPARPASQMLHTQAPFGSQLEYPTRAHADQDEPQTVVVNGLEPILAGNTKRVEIRPGSAATDNEQMQKLLELLAQQKKQSRPDAGASSSERFARSASAEQECINEVAGSSSELPLESPSDDVRHFRSEHENTEDTEYTPSLPRHREKPDKEILSRFSEDREATGSDQGQGGKDSRIAVEQNNAASSECAWMKGFVFNSDTLTVSKLQRQCLMKETSWLKPPPGHPPFQNGNMPQAILAVLHRIEDERVSAEDDGNTDVESDIDLSPDSLPATINLSAESVPQTTQENDDNNDENGDNDIPSSGQVYWPPSPQPPERPVEPHQDLPPDSSPVVQRSSAERTSQAHPNLFARSSQHPEVTDISDEVPAQPESSSLAIQNPVGLDDKVYMEISDEETDMEMEESIPHALGEDLTDDAGLCMDMPANSSPKPTEPQSVVQVRETPYGKGKIAQRTDDIPFRRSASEEAQSSSGESKNTSSTSVIHSTYNIPEPLNSVEIAQGHTNVADNVSKDQITITHERRESQGEAAVSGAGHALEDVQILDELPETEETTIVSSIEENPRVSAEPPSRQASPIQVNATQELSKSQGHVSGPSPNTPQAASGSIKRKLQGSPAKGSRRRSKRREIKIVGFGDITPVTVDPLTELREEREESLHRFREQRNSSTSFGGSLQPTRAYTKKPDMDSMDFDGADMSDYALQSDRMSPRHESLCEEPSPKPVQSTAPVQSRLLQEESWERGQLRSSQAKHHTAHNLQALLDSAVFNKESPMTVFESFKAAYPEYKGDTKHFHNQCKQIYALDLEDKMVPKWQWDDFIIRNRTDYRDYAMECLDRGENAEPYHRFYKNTVRDTLYRRGIIQGRNTLRKALEEVGIAIKDLDTSVDAPKQQSSSRESLPGLFQQVTKPRRSHLATSPSRPRHSLPASSYTNQQHEYANPKHRQAPSSASSQYRPRRQQAQPPSSSEPRAQEPTGDPYRDFFFGLQRSTSWTGSNKVDPSKSWPRNLESRPSIEDVPRLKVDVLKWGDVLDKGR